MFAVNLLVTDNNHSELNQTRHGKSLIFGMFAVIFIKWKVIHVLQNKCNRSLEMKKNHSAFYVYCFSSLKNRYLSQELIDCKA